MIRLSTAHAKARLSAKVERRDAKQAEEIMRFALFREVPKRQRRKKRKLNNGAAVVKGSNDGSDDGETDESEDELEPASAERMTTPTASRSRSTAPPAAQPPVDPIWGDESQDVEMAEDQAIPVSTALPTNDGQIRPERYICLFFYIYRFVKL